MWHLGVRASHTKALTRVDQNHGDGVSARKLSRKLERLCFVRSPKGESNLSRSRIQYLPGQVQHLHQVVLLQGGRQRFCTPVAQSVPGQQKPSNATRRVIGGEKLPVYPLFSNLRLVTYPGSFAIPNVSSCVELNMTVMGFNATLFVAVARCRGGTLCQCRRDIPGRSTPTKPLLIMPIKTDNGAAETGKNT